MLRQLPESFHRNDERLASPLEKVRRSRHCFELRHASWFADDVYAVREHRVALVIGDHPRGVQRHELTAPWTFVRFHYGRRGRGGNYSEREPEEWADRIRGWSRHVEVFAYFNNESEARAVYNATSLTKKLGLEPYL